jgi:fructose-1,6-bisphosphatase/inositol monophosphatase family enzyme
MVNNPLMAAKTISDLAEAGNEREVEGKQNEDPVKARFQQAQSLLVRIWKQDEDGMEEREEEGGGHKGRARETVKPSSPSN